MEFEYDVGSSHPGAGAGPKGPAVRRLKRYVSWVQNVVRQFGLYPLWTQGNLREFDPSKKLLLFTVRWIENAAYNGETLLVYNEDVLCFLHGYPGVIPWEVVPI
jgi:hypothetical protein